MSVMISVICCIKGSVKGCAVQEEKLDLPGCIGVSQSYNAYAQLQSAEKFLLPLPLLEAASFQNKIENRPPASVKSVCISVWQRYLQRNKGALGLGKFCAQIHC